MWVSLTYHELAPKQGDLWNSSPMDHGLLQPVTSFCTFSPMDHGLLQPVTSFCTFSQLKLVFTLFF